jgi:Zn-dependent protease with chaperone function
VDAERWEALVRRVEPEARTHPRRYRRKVAFIAVLGYLFIAALVGVLVALAGVLVFLALKESALLLKFVIPIIALLLVIARSLRVEFKPPPGVVLKREHAARLFSMVDDVRGTLRAPRIHEIRVDAAPNAAVTQIPRVLGLLPSRNYLLLGLPYFAALTADELRAVVAHEVGHVSRSHGRFGAFVYRVRQRWVALLTSLESRESIWTGTVRRFFAWYVPYFDAYTLPVLRAHEFEADDAAAQVAGKDAAAISLVKGVLAGMWLDQSYWPAFFRRAHSERRAPEAVLRPLLDAVATTFQHDEVEARYRQLVDQEPDPYSTHPTVAERLSHLGVEPEVALSRARMSTGEAARAVYLREAEQEVLAEVERDLRPDVVRDWREVHEQAQRDKRDLAELEERTELSPDDALRRAELTEALVGDESALARYREVLETEHDALARLSIGRLLLDRHDDAGLRWLDESVARDPELTLAASLFAHAFLEAHGRPDEAAVYWERVQQQLDA